MEGSKWPSIGRDHFNIYISAWSDQLKKKIKIYIDTEATHTIIWRDLVEPQRILVINQQEQPFLEIATRGSLSVHGSILMNFTLLSTFIEGKFLVTDIYLECALVLDLMQKCDLIVDLRSRLQRAPHGGVPLLTDGTAVEFQKETGSSQTIELASRHSPLADKQKEFIYVKKLLFMELKDWRQEQLEDVDVRPINSRMLDLHITLTYLFFP